MPGQLVSKSASTLPMKRLASVGATGVPMATPLSGWKCLSANPKVFSFKIRLSMSLSMLFLGLSPEVGGLVGIACCRAKLMPSA